VDNKSNTTTKVYNHKVRLEDNGAFKYERGTIESNALFLEETLEKLLVAERRWVAKRYQSKTKKDEAGIEAFKFAEAKLKDIRRGIDEVNDKADIIWKDIASGKQLTIN